MKHNKNFISTFGLITFLLITGSLCKAENPSHFKPKVGHISDGMPVMTLSAKTVKSKWEKWLSANGQSVNIDASSIRIVTDTASGGYILMAHDIGNKLRLAVALAADRGKLFEEKTEAARGSKTVICYCADSAQESQPNAVRTPDPWCTPCLSGSIKTVTVTASGKGIF